MNSRRRGYDLQEMWEANVAPWMMAARQSAGHMRHTADRERIRARGRIRARSMRASRRRWLLIAGAGMVMVGIAGTVTALQAQQRRRADEQYPQGEFAPAGAGAHPSGHRPPAHQQPQAQQEQARHQPQAPTSATAADRRGRPQ